MGPEQIAALTVSDIVGVEGLKRWHTIRMHREQSLAEHSFKVLLLAVRMASRLTGALALSHVEWVELYTHAVCHDLSELEDGDTPTPAKLGSTYNRNSTDFWLKRGINDGLLDPPIAAIIKAADLFEAWQYYKDYGYDDKDHAGSFILDGCAGRFIRYCQLELGGRFGGVYIATLCPDLLETMMRYRIYF